MKINKYIPQFILENYSSRNFNGIFNGYVMYIDIVGFTSMTQALLVNGNEGFEILSDLINQVFDPAIEKIYQAGGFISTFAGDAFTSIFKEQDIDFLSLIKISNEIKKDFDQNRIKKTRFGKFTLGLRIGLAKGNINWQIIRSEKLNSYFFSGTTIRSAIISAKKGLTNEIMIIKPYPESEHLVMEELTHDLFVLKEIHYPLPIKLELEQIIDENIRSFLPDSVLNLRLTGEFRDVVSCFIAFDETRNYEEYLAKIIQLTVDYGGYFDKIDLNELNGIILVLFGAPKSKSQDIFRVNDFAISVRSLPNFIGRIGLSFGTVYAGFIGSKLRQEYTAIGNSVNLASRLVTTARPGEIIIDPELQARSRKHYEISFKNYIELKGFVEQIASFQLIRKKDKRSADITQDLIVGRTVELRKLNEFIEPVFSISEEKNAGIMIISGEQGSGKSRLIKELRHNLQSKKFHWLFFPGDAIPQQSLNPIRYFLKNFFHISDENDQYINNSNFEDIYDTILTKNGFDKFSRELNVARPFIKSLLNLESDTLFLQDLNPDLIFKNTLRFLKTSILKLSSDKPVIMIVEDFPLVDKDTLNLINLLFEDTSTYPLTLIASFDSGKDLKYVYNIINKSQIRVFKLGLLTKNESRKLIYSVFSNHFQKKLTIPEKTVNQLWKLARGNAFYLEQFLSFFLEKGLIKPDLTIDKSKIELPESIKSVLVSRIDNLAPNLKLLAIKAAVIGRRFNRNILSSISFDEDLNNYLKLGEKQNLWHIIDKDVYQFNSNFIRDCFYELPIRKEVRDLHGKVAVNIENIYAGNLQTHYGELAYNYQKAENHVQTAKFLEKNGEWEIKNFRFKKALEDFEILNSMIYNNLIQDKNGNLQNRLMLYLAEIYLIQGNSNKAHKELLKIKPEKLADKILKDKFYYLLTKFYALKEDYENLITIAEISIKTTDAGFYKNYVIYYYLNTLRFQKDSTKFLKKAEYYLDYFSSGKNIYFESRIANLLGAYYLNKSQYTQALQCFNKALEISVTLDNPVLIRVSQHNLGVVHAKLSNNKKALQYYEQSLEIAENLGMIGSQSKLYSDIALIHISRGDLVKAEELFLQALDLVNFTENIMQKGLILYNLGEMYYRKKDYNKSLIYLEQSKKICKEIGDTSGLSYTNDLYGDILFSLGKLDLSEKIYLQNLDIQKKLHDKEGIAHTYGNLGNIAKSKGHFNKAENYYKFQQTQLHQIGDKEGEGKAYFNWAMLKIEQKELKNGLRKLHKAYNLFKGGPFEDISYKYITEISEKINN